MRLASALLAFTPILASAAVLPADAFMSDVNILQGEGRIESGVLHLRGQNVAIVTAAEFGTSADDSVLELSFTEPLERDVQLRIIFARLDLGRQMPPVDFTLRGGRSSETVDLGSSANWRGQIGQMAFVFGTSSDEIVSLSGLRLRAPEPGEGVLFAAREFLRPEAFLPSSVNLLYGTKLLGAPLAALLGLAAVGIFFFLGAERRILAVSLILGFAILSDLRLVRDHVAWASTFERTWFSQPAESRKFLNVSDVAAAMAAAKSSLKPGEDVLLLAEPDWPMFVQGEYFLLPHRAWSLKDWLAAGSPQNVTIVSYGTARPALQPDGELDLGDQLLFPHGERALEIPGGAVWRAAPDKDQISNAKGQTSEGNLKSDI